IQKEADFKDKGKHILTPSPGELVLGRAQRQRIQFTFVKADPAGDTDKNGWVQLFNGKDLTGWKTHPNQPGKWQVENGILIGSGPKSHLFSQGGTFENFHLRLEAKINQSGDSGVYFWTPFDLDPKRGLPLGPELQLAS